MRKVLLTLFTALCIAQCSKAQFVTLPDTMFVQWLRNNGYQACLNGNQLDTTCSNITGTINSLVIDPNGITDLYGIQFFDGLKELVCYGNSLNAFPVLPHALLSVRITSANLSSVPSLAGSQLQLFDCSDNHITTLPALPTSIQTITVTRNQITSLPSLTGYGNLKNLYCAQNNLSALPALPSTLELLFCGNNHISNLGASMPSFLRQLDCNHNGLLAMPAFSDSMRYVVCSYNQLSNLPTLPPYLTYLDCDSNHIGTLSSLPAQVTYLDCGKNLLATLPALPAALYTLICNNNSLSSLPALPQLGILRCQVNQLTSLPNLPSSLQWLDCCYNALTYLPALPTGPMSVLYCNNDQLTTLPALPDSVHTLNCSNNTNLTCLPRFTKIDTLNFSGTAVNCVPNYISTQKSTPPLWAVSLCASGNINACAFYPLTAHASESAEYFCPGSAVLFYSNATDGYPPYSYSWQPTFGVSNPNTANPTIHANGNTVYYVTITDSLGNQAVDSVEVRLDTFSLATLEHNVSCNGGSDGSTQVFVIGGVAPYRYSIGGGPFTGNDVFTGLGAGTYYVIVQDSIGCMQWNSQTPSVITQPPVLRVQITSTSNGAAFDTLTSIAAGGTSPYTYLWSDGFNGSGPLYIDTLSPSGFYTVSVTDNNGCVARDSIYEGCINGCVWPGDANNDGIANYIDVLPIGIAYADTGHVRPQASIVWYPQPCQNWNDSLYDTINFKHIDCNGNGAINADDTMAIARNYSFVPGLGSVGQWNNSMPSFQLTLVRDTSADGDTVFAHLILGSPGRFAQNVYGLAFKFNFDPLAVDSNSIQLTYKDSSWLCSGPSDHIDLTRVFFDQAQIQTSLSRIDHHNRSGWGEIATVSMKITTGNINGKDLEYYLMKCYISDLLVIDSSGAMYTYNQGFDSSYVSYEVTGINDVRNEEAAIRVFPNPALDKLTVVSPRAKMEEVEILNAIGERVADFKEINEQHAGINISGLPPGAYLLNIKCNNIQYHKRFQKIDR